MMREGAKERLYFVTVVTIVIIITTIVITIIIVVIISSRYPYPGQKTLPVCLPRLTRGQRSYADKCRQTEIERTR